MRLTNYQQLCELPFGEPKSVFPKISMRTSLALSSAVATRCSRLAALVIAETRRIVSDASGPLVSMRVNEVVISFRRDSGNTERSFQTLTVWRRERRPLGSSSLYAYVHAVASTGEKASMNSDPRRRLFWAMSLSR